MLALMDIVLMLAMLPCHDAVTDLVKYRARCLNTLRILDGRLVVKHRVSLPTRFSCRVLKSAHEMCRHISIFDSQLISSRNENVERRAFMSEAILFST